VNDDLFNWTDNRVSSQMMGRDCPNWDQSVCQNAHFQPIERAARGLPNSRKGLVNRGS
jgi:hypothetical protein